MREGIETGAAIAGAAKPLPLSSERQLAKSWLNSSSPLPSGDASLTEISPILPLISAAACLTLGSACFTKLEDLRKQAISIVRTNSYPPPAADLSPLNLV